MTELTDEQISHIWDTYVGEPTISRPLDSSDKLAFARAVIADHEAQRQDGQEPYGWQVAGTRELHTGEFAEIDAKAEAKCIGGTCKAFPLYTAPQHVAQVEKP